jgi:hypothetical protein
LFAHSLKDENIHIRKRLFLTATPRHYDIRHRDREGDFRIVSMGGGAVRRVSRSASGVRRTPAASHLVLRVSHIWPRARVLPAAQADSKPFTTRGPDPLGSPMAILFPLAVPPPRSYSKKPRSSGPYRPASRSTGSPLDA